LLFVQDTGLKMTPVTLELVIDDSKRERKRESDMENDSTCIRVAASPRFKLNCLRALSRVNENARAY
jgi:hypothetical protein